MVKMKDLSERLSTLGPHWALTLAPAALFWSRKLLAIRCLEHLPPFRILLSKHSMDLTMNIC